MYVFVDFKIRRTRTRQYSDHLNDFYSSHLPTTLYNPEYLTTSPREPTSVPNSSSQKPTIVDLIHKLNVQRPGHPALLLDLCTQVLERLRAKVKVERGLVLVLLDDDELRRLVALGVGLLVDLVAAAVGFVVADGFRERLQAGA